MRRRFGRHRGAGILPLRRHPPAPALVAAESIRCDRDVIFGLVAVAVAASCNLAEASASRVCPSPWPCPESPDPLSLPPIFLFIMLSFLRQLNRSHANDVAPLADPPGGPPDGPTDRPTATVIVRSGEIDRSAASNLRKRNNVMLSSHHYSAQLAYVAG